MNEKNFQSLFTKYIQANPPQTTEVYELKIVKQRSLAFDRVAEHQVKALVDSACACGTYYKIPDMAAKNMMSAPKPFDCFFINRAKAYLIIWFYKPRQKKEFLKINIFEFNRLRGILSPRKSIPEAMCREIAKEIIHI